MAAAFHFLSATDSGLDAGTALPVGTPVVDARGDTVGSLTGTDPDGLVVEHGILFVSTLIVPYAAVDRVEDGTVVLGWTKAELQAAS